MMAAPVLNDPLSGGSKSMFKVGTLTYTKAGLLNVFFWMLWGDLCVQIMEQGIPKLLPLQVKSIWGDEGTRAIALGWVMFVMPMVELVLAPFVSTWSDRVRTRWGRRKPFIIAGTIPLTVFLLIVGYSEQLGNWSYDLTGGFGLSKAKFIIWALCILLAIFQVFNVIVIATYYYMIADVIPQPVIGRFTSLYRVMSTMGGMMFDKFIFDKASDPSRMGLVYIGLAAIYFLSFALMSWQVKEGEYPPPQPLTEKGNPGEALVEWVRQSFSIGFYVKLYCIGLFYYLAAIANAAYLQNYAIDVLGMTKKEFGNANFYGGLATIPVFLVLGPIVDKFHPLRVIMLGMGLIAVAGFGGFIGVHDTRTFWIFTIGNKLACAVYLGGQIGMLPRMLPRAQYGQYCSANNILSALGKLAPPLLGMMIAAYSLSVLPNYGGYRLSFAWQGVMAMGGTAIAIWVFLSWMKLGGDRGYVPPVLVRGQASAFGGIPKMPPMEDGMTQPGPVRFDEGKPVAGETDPLAPKR